MLSSPNSVEESFSAARLLQFLNLTCLARVEIPSKDGFSPAKDWFSATPTFFLLKICWAEQALFVSLSLFFLGDTWSKSPPQVFNFFLFMGQTSLRERQTQVSESKQFRPKNKRLLFWRWKYIFSPDEILAKVSRVIGISRVIKQQLSQTEWLLAASCFLLAACCLRDADQNKQKHKQER